MHLKLKTNKRKDSLDSGVKRSNRKSQNMASSLVNDDDDNATSSTTTTRNTQQQQQQQNINNNNSSSNNNKTNCLNQQNNNNTTAKMHGNEAKQKKENLQQRKQELEKLLNEKSWLLQQLQKQEAEILNGNFEYMNFNEFISNLAVQYKQEQVIDGGSTAGAVSQLSSSNDDAILRRKPLTSKENHQQLQHNIVHRRQSEISNRSSEYDNYPHHDSLSTHSDGGASSAGRSGAGSSMTMHQAQQAQQQYNAKSALKKRSATVAGTVQQQSVTNLQMLKQQQQLEHQLQQQQLIYKQHHYHHPQQHLFKQHMQNHQVLMPHLQYATQKFYYTTLQPQTQSQNPQQQQPQYGRYLKAQTTQQQQHNTMQQQQQQLHHQQQQQQLQLMQQHQQQQQQLSQQHEHSLQQQQHQQHQQLAEQQSPTRNQQQHHILYTTKQGGATHLHTQQEQLLLTPPHGGSSSSGIVNIDNISLYSLNSNNVATLHRQAQQQLPIIVQCDKYYLSPTTHHVSHNEGGGFIKSSQNIKEYISPLNSPQHSVGMGNAGHDRKLASQTNLNARAMTNTPSIDAISLAPSYMSMETVEYMTSPTTLQQQQHPPNLRWRSQTNLPPVVNSNSNTINEMKSHSSDMLNNNQYYHTPITQQPPPQVTLVKPFKPLDEISINSYSSDTQKKTKPKQWMESSLDGPIIKQTSHHLDINDNAAQQQQVSRSKLSSQSLNTSRHYSMSAAQAKSVTSASSINNNINSGKLSQSTSYLNQLDAQTVQPLAASSTSSISQAYSVEVTPPPNSMQQQSSYKYMANKPPPRPPLYINAGSIGSTGVGGGNGASLQYQAHEISPSSGTLSIATSPTMAGISSNSGLSPGIRIESPKNVTVVQPATFQPYKEVTKPFEMSDFYKYSTKYRQKENNSNNSQGHNEH